VFTTHWTIVIAFIDNLEYEVQSVEMILRAFVTWVHSIGYTVQFYFEFESPLKVNYLFCVYVSLNTFCKIEFSKHWKISLRSQRFTSVWCTAYYVKQYFKLSVISLSTAYYVNQYFRLSVIWLSTSKIRPGDRKDKAIYFICLCYKRGTIHIINSYFT